MKKYTRFLLILALGFLAWEIFYFLSKRPQTAERVELRLKGFVPAPVPSPSVQPSASARPALKETIIAEPAKFHLQRKAVNSAGGIMTLQLLVEWNEQERPAFESAIRSDLSGKKIYLSLETVPPDGAPAVVSRAEFPPASFFGRFYATVSVPAAAQPRHIGIFICTDANPGGTCSEKDHWRGGLNAPSAGGRNYYFAYLLMIGDYVFAPDYSLGPLVYKGLRRAAISSVFDDSGSSSGSDAQVQQGRAVARRIKALDTKLNSGGVDLSGPLIVLRLPRAAAARRSLP